MKPAIVWFRRDLRLDDHAALRAAEGRPVIALFIREPGVEALGDAPKFRLHLALESFAKRLAEAGGRLVLRSGEAGTVLNDLVDETGADAVYWQRRYDPDGIATDKAVKAALKERGLTVESFPGFTLTEPVHVLKDDGTPYRVFTPYWKTLTAGDVPDALPPVEKLTSPDGIASDDLGDWHLTDAMRRGADIVAAHQCVGEEAALDRMLAYREEVGEYERVRNDLGQNATSHLSENLAVGEISPRRIWTAMKGHTGAEPFLRQLVWRDFAWSLAYHTPELLTGNWRPEWDGFGWRHAPAQLRDWQRGQTGVEIVDAAMRELWVTGRMHNRARMIVASFLTKHLLIDWREGLKWFEHTLTDWDAANNAMGWQWVAGTGPDAAPYFRVFNPDTQGDKFDPDRTYRDKWLNSADFAKAIPESWGETKPPKEPIVGLSEGRDRALAAYQAHKDGKGG